MVNLLLEGRDSSPNRGGRDFESKESKASRVFVGNLSFKTTWQGLKDHMREAGDVIRADIFSDPTGRSKGCGYVISVISR